LPADKTNFPASLPFLVELIQRFSQSASRKKHFSYISICTYVFSEYADRSTPWCFNLGGGGIGVYKSADPPKFEAKSAIRAKILDKYAICCINKIRNPCKTFARSEIRTIFSVKSDDPKTYSPPPPICNPLYIRSVIFYRLFFIFVSDCQTVRYIMIYF
jgi:hypothetical protein